MTYSTTTRMELTKVVAGSGQTVDHAATLTADMDELDDRFVHKLIVSPALRPNLVSDSFDGSVIYETGSFSHMVDDGQSWTPITKAAYSTDKTADTGVALDNGVAVFTPFDGDGSAGGTWGYSDPTTAVFNIGGYFFVSYGLRIDEATTLPGTRQIALIHYNTLGVEIERFERILSIPVGFTPSTMNCCQMIKVFNAGERLRIRLLQTTNASVDTVNTFHTAIIDIAHIRPLMGFGGM